MAGKKKPFKQALRTDGEPVQEPRKQSEGEALFALYWRIDAGNDPLPEREYKFCPGRQYRFDFCFLREKVAVEIDGGQYAPRGGRHNTDADRHKINIAARLGWRVIRFSPQMLKNDPLACINLVKEALSLKETG